jgi:hypothetical protein
MFRLTIAALVLSALIGSAPSFGSNGNDILDRCRINNKIQNTSACSAFVRGMIEGISVSFGLFAPENRTLSNQDYYSKLHEKIGYCIPNEASISQITEIYLEHLNEHANVRHMPASLLFIDAMRDAFPCTR